MSSSVWWRQAIHSTLRVVLPTQVPCGKPSTSTSISTTCKSSERALFSYSKEMLTVQWNNVIFCQGNLFAPHSRSQNNWRIPRPSIYHNVKNIFVWLLFHQNHNHTVTTIEFQVASPVDWGHDERNLSTNDALAQATSISWHKHYSRCNNAVLQNLYLEFTNPEGWKSYDIRRQITA